MANVNGNLEASQISKAAAFFCLAILAFGEWENSAALSSSSSSHFSAPFNLAFVRESDSVLGATRHTYGRMDRPSTFFPALSLSFCVLFLLTLSNLYSARGDSFINLPFFSISDPTNVERSLRDTHYCVEEEEVEKWPDKGERGGPHTTQHNSVSQTASVCLQYIILCIKTTRQTVSCAYSKYDAYSRMWRVRACFTMTDAKNGGLMVLFSLPLSPSMYVCVRTVYPNSKLGRPIFLLEQQIRMGRNFVRKQAPIERTNCLCLYSR